MTTFNAANEAGAAASVPNKNEAPGTTGSAEGQADCRGGSLHSASASNDPKGFAALQSAYALQGYALHRVADGLLLVERWGYSRTLDSMTQAAQFLSQIGGR